MKSGRRFTVATRHLTPAEVIWIEGQCQERETSFRNNNSKKAYQLVNDLTRKKQSESKFTPLQDKSRQVLQRSMTS